MIENMPNRSTAHEVLAVVFQVRQLAHPKSAAQRAAVGTRHGTRSAARGRCPAARLRHDEDMTSSVRRQLAEKVDLRELAHLEQLAVFSDPTRVPGAAHHRVDVPRPGALPRHPGAAARHPLASGERAAADGVRPPDRWSTHAHTRLVAKLSYTNIGFALAPREFALSTLRDIYGAALGYQVDATNLQRVLGASRRHHPDRHDREVGPKRWPTRRHVPLHRVRSTGSPTSSPHYVRRGEPRTWQLAVIGFERSRKRQWPDGLGQCGRLDRCRVDRRPTSRGASPQGPARCCPTPTRSTSRPRASSTPSRAPCCAPATSSWPSSG